MAGEEIGQTTDETERCETCNGTMQIWDRGWYTCPDCFDRFVRENTDSDRSDEGLRE